MMYSSLEHQGLIQFSRIVNNTSVRVCFVDNEGDAEIKITDTRNIGYQYLKYMGEPYFECTNCGIVTKIKSPGVGAKQKYCKDCAISIAIQQSVNSVMRGRALSKNMVK